MRYIQKNNIPTAAKIKSAMIAGEIRNSTVSFLRSMELVDMFPPCLGLGSYLPRWQRLYVNTFSFLALFPALEVMDVGANSHEGKYRDNLCPVPGVTC